MPGMNTDMSASDDHLSRLDTAEGKKKCMGLNLSIEIFPT